MVAAAVTHPGRVRSSNEDSLLVTPRLVAVADGLGGHAAGEIASRIAVDRLRPLGDDPDLAPDDLPAAIADINDLLLEDARTHPDRWGMGTTLTGLALARGGDEDQCVVFNVGDSRVYRWREADGLVQVTVDHSEVQELQAAGRITAEDAARHPRRNVVTRCLGSVPAPEADLWMSAPTGRERFLVCSDGLSGELGDAEIAEVLAAHERPGAAASDLLERALSAGGRDNIAVIVVDLDGGGESGGQPAGTVPGGRITQRT